VFLFAPGFQPGWAWMHPSSKRALASLDHRFVAHKEATAQLLLARFEISLDALLCKTTCAYLNAELDVDVDSM
jgi:hypothetical protein